MYFKTFFSLLILFVFTLPSFGQSSERPETIVIPVSSSGDVEENRNCTEEEISRMIKRGLSDEVINNLCDNQNLKSVDKDKQEDNLIEDLNETEKENYILGFGLDYNLFLGGGININVFNQDKFSFNFKYQTTSRDIGRDFKNSDYSYKQIYHLTTSSTWINYFPFNKSLDGFYVMGGFLFRDWIYEYQIYKNDNILMESFKTKYPTFSIGFGIGLDSLDETNIYVGWSIFGISGNEPEEIDYYIRDGYLPSSYNYNSFKEFHKKSSPEITGSVRIGYLF